jgi:hypothetical protein
MPCPLEKAAKKYRPVIDRYQRDPPVALKQWLNSATAYPMNLISLFVKRSHGWYGHDHVANLTKFHDEGFFSGHLLLLGTGCPAICNQQQLEYN